MTKNDLQLNLERCYWKYARTLAHNPHHYTLRETWKSDELFEDAIRALDEYSIEERFGKRIYKICYLGNFKYWHMGDAINEIALINKKQIKFARA